MSTPGKSGNKLEQPPSFDDKSLMLELEKSKLKFNKFITEGQKRLLEAIKTIKESPEKKEHFKFELKSPTSQSLEMNKLNLPDKVEFLELRPETKLPSPTTVGFQGNRIQYQPSGEYSSGTAIGFARNAPTKVEVDKVEKTSPKIGFRF
jgi:hypothetical protein